MKSDLEVFARCTRRAIRDWTADNGMVPGMLAAASVGANPRRVRLRPRLDLLTEAQQVAEAHRDLVRRHDSDYAAIGKRLGDEFEPRLCLMCFSTDELVLWQATIGLDGLHGWEPGTFAVPPTLRELQEVIGG